MDDLEKKKNIEKFLSENNMSGNFLLSANKTTPINSVMPAVSPFKKRLNDYDSSLFEETSVQKIEDPALKLQAEIKKTEETIATLTEELQLAETLRDTMRTKDVFIRKLMAEKKLEKLQQEYKSNGFDKKQKFVNLKQLPGAVKSEIALKFKSLIKNSGIINAFSPVAGFLRTKETLNRLDRINKSVDGLITSNTPFGENEQRYKLLVNQLTQANRLQNEIKKEI